MRPELRSAAFWRVQAMVAAVTAAHYLIELPALRQPFEHLHHVPPILYAFPIIYGSLHFGRRGGVLTGLWCAALTAPNMIWLHHQSLEWMVELTQLGVAIAVALLFSVLVEREARARRRAEEMASRIGLVNRRITRAQEDERLRIARELHDDTVQSLVLLCHGLDATAAVSGLPGAASDRLRELRIAAESTLAGVRQFSRDLRPSVLDDLGLLAAVEWLLDSLAERCDVEARLEISGSPRRLPSETELALFRVVQEALRNVEKHAGAAHVSVRASFEPRRVVLSVIDDGRGFDLSPAADLVASGRLGLAGMHERAQLVEARLEIRSTLGRGTTVVATLDRDDAGESAGVDA